MKMTSTCLVDTLEPFFFSAHLFKTINKSDATVESQKKEFQ